MNKTWQLDLIGNKVSYDNNGVIDNRVYNETHQLNSTSTGQNYTYDKRGNQTGSTSSNSSSDESQEQNTVSVWDIDGHLASVSEAGQLKASYTYDALGRRIRKTLYDNEGNVSKKRLYIRSGQRVLEEYKSDGESTSIDKRYVYGAYVDEVIYAIHGANQELYYHSDRQYNIRSLSDWKGRAVEYYDYTPYGERTINTRWSGKNRSTSAYENAIGFTGRHLDSETGLYYFRARYYDTEQGRFISRDPAGYIDGLGLYNGYFAWGFAMDPSGMSTNNCPDEDFGDYETLSWESLGISNNAQAGGFQAFCLYRRERSRFRSCCTEEFGIIFDIETQQQTAEYLVGSGQNPGFTCPSTPPGGSSIGNWTNI